MSNRSSHRVPRESAGLKGRLCLLALTVACSMTAAVDCMAVQSAARERVERKMREAQRLVPPWVKAGGSQVRATILMQNVDRALQSGDLETAERNLDEVLALVKTPPSESRPTGLEQKIKEARERIPKWVEAGGNRVQVMLLMQRVDAALSDGRFERAEAVLDEVLGIVRRPPSETSRVTGVEKKMKEVQNTVPKWIEAGGNPTRVMILMREVDALLADGKVAAAENNLDKVLEIIKTVPGPGTSRILLRVYGADGRPTSKSSLAPKFHETIVTGVFPLDMDYNAVPMAVGYVEDGGVHLEDPLPARIIIHFFPRVAGFGQVKVYADNGGEGYPTSGDRIEIDVPLEAARSRIAKTRALLDAIPGDAFRSETKERLASAERHLVSSGLGSQVMAREVYAALGDALWAGEMATLDVARYRLAQAHPRKNFLFGCALSPNFARWNESTRKLFSDVFGFATLATLYLKGYEPKRGEPNPVPTEDQLSWLHIQGIVAKGHPLVYLIDRNQPDWLHNAGTRERTEAMRDRVRREVSRFKGRFRFYDVVNEPNNPNPSYSQAEIIDISREALRAAKAADPSAQRIINVNMPTGDLLADPNAGALALAGKAQTPYQFLQKLAATDADYEIIGIQMYYSGLDIMETSRMLDRYARLGKPIHITEIGVSSSPGIDPKSEYFQSPDSIAALGEWHGPWSQARQAEWLEQFYTVAYSKPSVEAISWWDFLDDFWPHGGLLKRDGSPKESYWRLKRLLESWGVRRTN